MIETGIADVMTRSPHTIGADRTIEAAARLLVDHAIGSLIVVDARTASESDRADESGDDGTSPPDETAVAIGTVQGIVTEADIVALVAEGQAPTTSVTEVMSAPLVTIEQSEGAGTAAERMKREGVKKLPVVEGDQLVGIVTTTDLTHYLPRYRLDIQRTE